MTFNNETLVGLVSESPFSDRNLIKFGFQTFKIDSTHISFKVLLDSNTNYCERVGVTLLDTDRDSSTLLRQCVESGIL